ncbi:MAG: hypothetical protein JRG91_18640, partial [Deltaproteobacteria bacterium]|nr:hypothetical protein [Deltaproteobacteria bacterium]
EIGPEAEVCNGLDDDCNGLVDDGLGLGDACGTDEGECVEGRWVCNDRGELECMFGRGPSPEICDCLDNDCDALIDEENPCPSGVCVDCSCAGPCNPTEEWPCPSGRVCMEVEGEDGYWCVGDPCEDVTCEGCDRCVYGECVDPCEGVVCPAGQICSVDESCTARCVPTDCYAPGFECDEGERCRGGECEADPCWGVDCGDDRFCREGECFDACGPEDACEEGFVCRDGACIADPCFGVVCTGGRICVDGECVDDPCEDVFCPPPLICIDGACTDDPCSYIDCPDGYVCVGDTCVDGSTIETDETPEAVPDADTDGGGAGQDILATGAGGCAGCTLAARGPDGGLAGLAALLVLAAGMIARRRRES